jgi:hypothetical protein
VPIDDDDDDEDDSEYEDKQGPNFKPRLVKLEPRTYNDNFKIKLPPLSKLSPAPKSSNKNSAKQCKTEPKTLATAASMYKEEDFIVVTLETLEKSCKRTIGPYQCGVCFTKIKYFNDIRRHLRFECIYCEKRYACQMCGKKYFRSSHLTRHMQTAHKLLTI